MLSFAQSCKPLHMMIMFFPLYWSKLRLTLFKAIPEQVPLNGSSVSGWSLLLFIVLLPLAHNVDVVCVFLLFLISFILNFPYPDNLMDWMLLHSTYPHHLQLRSEISDHQLSFQEWGILGGSGLPLNSCSQVGALHVQAEAQCGR